MRYKMVIILTVWLCRLRAASKAQADGVKKTRTRDRSVRAHPAPEANAELQSNIDVCLIRCFYQPSLFFLF
jgi:hypothetical protein